MSKIRSVGDEISAENARWTFAGQTSENFDSHVLRSVPLYKEGHELVTKLSDFFLQEGSVCYELGCSTGRLTSRLAQHNRGKNVRFIGIDSEPDMVTQARKRCTEFPNVQIVEGNVVDIDLERADLIVAYYTVQFVRPKFRQILFDRIFAALNWGGAFLLFEKVRSADARFQDIATSLYTDYKLEQGYSADEIVAKARSLKGVLDPFSSQANLELLKRAGFVDMMSVLKYVCFEGFLAIK